MLLIAASLNFFQKCLNSNILYMSNVWALCFSTGDPCEPGWSPYRRNSLHSHWSAWICRTSKAHIYRNKCLLVKIWLTNWSWWYFRFPCWVKSVSSTGQPGVCCGKDWRSADGERAAPQRRRLGGYRARSGACQNCLQGEVRHCLLSVCVSLLDSQFVCFLCVCSISVHIRVYSFQ